MITTEMVRELRERTGAGMMNCKNALTESGGDMQRAITILREKGLSAALKKAGRQAGNGLIGSYIHMDKIGVLLEVNCETDFVARTEDFRGLVKDISLHIAAANPSYISKEDVPSDVMEKEKAIYRVQITGKPENVIDKIVAGKLDKFFSEVCLIEQVFVKDPEQKQRIKDLLTEKIALLGENIIIRRFKRFQLGEEES